MVYRLVIAYRGGRYHGWQRQPEVATVQGEVEAAVAEIAGRRLAVTGAGRTDAGVHARGQVAHLESSRPLETRALVHGVNHHLPEDIRVLAADRMRDGFDARRTAQAKEYRYRLVPAAVLSPLERPFAVRVAPEIDVSALRRAAVTLPGRHDWSSFALAGGAHTQPYRTVHTAEWRSDGEALVFRIVGDGFLRGMVRSIVGTLIEVGRGRRSVASFEALLAGGPRGAAGPTAPARGLVLWRVDYPPGWRVRDGGPA